MAIATFSGINSGIQWRDMVDQIMTAERSQRLNPLQASRSDNQKQLSTLTSLEGLLNSLKEVGSGFTDAASLARYKVTGEVGADKALNVTITDQTRVSAGTYVLEVGSTARQPVHASRDFADPSGALPAGGSFTVNGVSLPASTTDSWNELRDRINQSGAGVRAEVLATATDSSSSGASYRLVLSPTDAAGRIELTDPDGFLSATGLMTPVQTGSDAVLSVNSIDVTRSGNRFTDAIPGLEITANRPTSGSPVTVSVTRDLDAEVAEVQEMVDAYNKLRGFYDTQRASRSPTLRESFNAVKDVILQRSSDPAVGTTDHLSLIGVEVTRDGVLEIDGDALRTALESNRDETMALLADVGTRLSGAVDRYTRTQTGLIDLQRKSLDAANRRIDSRELDVEDRLQRMEDRMIEQYIAMEEALGQIQSQSSWLFSQLSALSASQAQ